MKGITTLEKVRERVDELSINCSDAFVDAQDISFENLKTINIAGQPHHLRPTGQNLVGIRYGLPLPYLRRCPEEVQALNLNYWIKQERNEKLFLRFDGNDVRAVFTPRYKPLDHKEVLDRLNDLGYVSEAKVQCYLDQNFMSVNIPDGSKTFAVNGDKITPGITLANSEVGLSSLKISAFFLRLVCTNGLIGKTQVSSSFRHISRRIMEDLPNVLTAVGYNLTQQREKFRISLQTHVDDPLSTIKTFNRQFQLGKIEVEAVDWAWPFESGFSMFSVVNTYTRAAEFPGMTAESSYNLQKVGGNILAMLK